MRAWIGIALLSVSWLVGLRYYHGQQWWESGIERAEDARKPPAPDASPPTPELSDFTALPTWPEASLKSAMIWAVTVLAGTLLLIGRRVRMPSWIASAVALVMVLAALAVVAPGGLNLSWPYGAASTPWYLRPLLLLFLLPYRAMLLPWPYRAAPLLVAAGLLLNLLAIAARRASLQLANSPGGERSPFWHRWAPRMGRGALLTGGGLVRVAAGCLLAGCVLLAQAVAMSAYAGWTARCHDVPAPLPRMVAAVAEAIGIHTGVNGSTVAASSMRMNHRFGATWELLLDPVTWCFLAGAAVLLAWRARTELSGSRRFLSWTLTLLKLLLLVALWLPLRAALLMAIYLDDALRTDYDALLESMQMVWNPWVLLALVVVPVLLGWRFARLGARGAGSPSTAEAKPRSQDSRATTAAWLDLSPAVLRPLAVVLALIASALFALGLYWDPVGRPKAGRVVFEEYHSADDDLWAFVLLEVLDVLTFEDSQPIGDEGWERTDQPYDTQKYGELADYTYASLYQYLGHYYNTSQLKKRIDSEALKDCDVLVLKTPTRPYSVEEVEAVCRFVENGGGLLLIGEHTDVYGTGTHLNAVAERFGFKYRFDSVFSIDSPPEHPLDRQLAREERVAAGKPVDENSVFDEHYARPPVPHPVVGNVREMYFAVSCSIEPGASPGRAVILGTGLTNLDADYHALNYYPQVVDEHMRLMGRADMRYGAFVQLWSTRHGRGRVLGFTDSTIFSDFCVFEPGKAELVLGMVQWLNHNNSAGDPRLLLWAAGLVLLAGALAASWRWPWGWVLLVSAGLLGWTSAAWATRQWNTMPAPEVRAEAPMVRVVLDRNVAACKFRHPKNGFTSGSDKQFGLFERWLQRLGYVTVRPTDWQDDFSGDLLVISYPKRPLPPDFRQRLEQYVRSGGKLLVLDSPENEGSNANELLEPFGLSLDWSDREGGELNSRGRWPTILVGAAATVKGGQSLAWIGDRPVAASVVCEKGSVTVVGFGSRFTDANMGVIGDVEPSEDLRQVYEVQFSLVRSIMESR